MGIICKMYTNESGGLFPAKVRLCDFSGDVLNRNYCWAPDPLCIYPEYLTDAKVLLCPSDSQGDQVLEPGGVYSWYNADGTIAIDPVTGCGNFPLEADASYTYSGYVMPEDNRILRNWPNFDTTTQDGIPDVIMEIQPMFNDPFTDHQIDHPAMGSVPLYRLREGIERFFITDINNPAASSSAQSSLAVMCGQAQLELGRLQPRSRRRPTCSTWTATSNSCDSPAKPSPSTSTWPTSSTATL